MSPEQLAAHQARVKGRTVDLGSGGEEKRGKGQKRAGAAGATEAPRGHPTPRKAAGAKPGAGKGATQPTEAQEQAVVVLWWALCCKTKGLDERLLASVPNGAILGGDARLRAIQMRRLKATGLRPGYPDLLLDLPMWDADRRTVLFHGMRIEMKRKGGPKPTPEQASYHEMLRSQGYNCVVSIGADEAINAIKSYVERAGGFVKTGALRDLTNDLTKDFPNPYAAGIRRV